MSLVLADDWRVFRKTRIRARVTECAADNNYYIVKLTFKHEGALFVKYFLYFPVDTVIMSQRLVPGINSLDTLYRLCSNLEMQLQLLQSVNAAMVQL